jgi:hypothetical protein
MSDPCYFVAHADGGGRHALVLDAPVVDGWRRARCGVAVGPADPAQPFLDQDVAVCQRCLLLALRDTTPPAPLVEGPVVTVQPCAVVDEPSLWGSQ